MDSRKQWLGVKTNLHVHDRTPHVQSYTHACTLESCMYGYILNRTTSPLGVCNWRIVKSWKIFEETMNEVNKV